MTDLIPVISELSTLSEISWDHVFLQAPHAFPGGLPSGYSGYQWFGMQQHLQHILQNRSPESLEGNDVRLPAEFYNSRKALRASMANLEQTYPKSFILGFSQGGMLGLDYVLHEQIFSKQGFVKGLILLSSIISTPEFHELWPPRGEVEINLPIFQSHGRHDSILPFAYGEYAANRLSEHNPLAKFIAFDGDHSIPHQVLVALNHWLEVNL